MSVNEDDIHQRVELRLIVADRLGSWCEGLWEPIEAFDDMDASEASDKDIIDGITKGLIGALADELYMTLPTQVAGRYVVRIIRLSNVRDMYFELRRVPKPT